MIKTDLPVDQADKLRKIVTGLKERSERIIDNAAARAGKKARLIAVTSGKGGVGKTSLTINIAIELSRNGYKVVVIDGDLGLANIEVMLGVIPKYSMHDIVKSGIRLSDVMFDGPMGIKLISGGTGIMEMAYLAGDKLNKLLDTLSALDNYADFILIDTGAGISRNVTKFVLSVREVILVTNSEPTSITDTYAILKIISMYNKKCRIKMIANIVESSAEAEDIISRINTAAKKFINAEVKSLGYIKNDPLVSKSIKKQIPLIISHPKSKVAKRIEDITKRILWDSEYQRKSEGIRGMIYEMYLSVKPS